MFILIAGGVVFFLQQGGETGSDVLEDSGLGDFEDNIVVLTNNGYSPNILQVEVGDTIVFKNESSSAMWPATAIHPTHTVYPGSDIEKCGGSEASILFDACSSYDPGSSWSFQFNKAGSWKYHNHLNPVFTGTIVVKE